MTPERARFLRALLMVVIAASSWGCWSLFLRPSGIPAAVSAPVILLVMGFALLPMRRLDGVRPIWDRTSLLLLAGLSLSDALNIATFFAAMDVTTLGVAVLSHYLTPLIVALAAPFVEGERIPGARRCAAVATVGLALVLQPWQHADGQRLLGAALGAISAVGYAGNVFLTTRLVPRVGAARSVGYHSFVSAAILLPLAPMAAWATVTPRGLLFLVLGGLSLGAVSCWLFSRGLPVVGPTLGSTVAFLEPIGAVLIGWLAWNERLGPLAALGALMILGSGAWVTRMRARQGTLRLPRGLPAEG